MTETEWWVAIVQTAILILGLLGVGFIPQYFYQKKLDKINNEVAKLHITVEQNHPIKMEKYKNFVENFWENTKITNETVKQKKMLLELKSISNAVFLFGSAETLRAFLVIRSQGDMVTQDQKYKGLVDMAKFMVSLRKDLNNGNIDITAEDYLKLQLNDWEQVKDKLLPYL